LGDVGRFSVKELLACPAKRWPLILAFDDCRRRHSRDYQRCHATHLRVIFTISRSNKMRHVILAISLTLVPTMSHAIEEPSYNVIRKIGDVEIRHYDGYVVAQTLVLADADKAGNQGFRILANYIFGDNTAKTKLAMTAPVMQAAQPESVKLAMTAPVMQAKMGECYLVQFVLPKDITLANAPIPNDIRVELREVAAADVAVITFSGFWSKGNLDKQLNELTSTLTTERLRWSGEPIYARYNPPWTPWFLRRHEIWLRLEP
jgi:hypothetical protein